MEDKRDFEYLNKFYLHMKTDPEISENTTEICAFGLLGIHRGFTGLNITRLLEGHEFKQFGSKEQFGVHFKSWEWDDPLVDFPKARNVQYNPKRQQPPTVDSKGEATGSILDVLNESFKKCGENRVSAIVPIPFKLIIASIFGWYSKPIYSPLTKLGLMIDFNTLTEKDMEKIKAFEAFNKL